MSSLPSLPPSLASLHSRLRTRHPPPSLRSHLDTDHPLNPLRNGTPASTDASLIASRNASLRRLMSHHSRHLTLPFTLRNPDFSPRLPTPTEAAAIASLFPNIYALSFYPPGLIIRCKTLPPRPWPLSVAGLAVWITTDDTELPLPRGFAGLAPDFEDLRQTPPNSGDVVVIMEHMARKDVAVRTVGWVGGRFIVMVEKPVDRRVLPRAIMGFRVVWCWCSHGIREIPVPFSTGGGDGDSGAAERDEV